MIGENDRLLPSNRHLFADLGAEPKAMIEIACASHFAQWEIQRRVLQRAALEWLEGTTVEGRPAGRFRADAQGRVTPLP